jgi:SAM-dependent methyltransferase
MGNAAAETPPAGFWSENQPGFRFTDAPAGSPEFFRDVERHRYELEPHIPEMARFDSWTGRDVLEVGCGVGTDGARFAAAGARYRGIDANEAAAGLARRRFELYGLDGELAVAPATALPFDDDSFDLVYSHGVLHHVEDVERAVDEIRRVLRPGGMVLAMLYHRRSLNYAVNIMVVRRLGVAALLLPGGPDRVARLTGEDPAVLEGHVALLREHGWRYLTDRRLFLSNNTDGPGNPLSRVYSRDEAVRLFAGFDAAETAVRYLNLRIVPGGARLVRTGTARRLERRIGWHLYVRARKPEEKSSVQSAT